MDAQDHPQHEQGEQMELVSTDELAKREAKVILGRYGLVTDDGRADHEAIADRIEQTVKAALVETPGERTKRTVWAHDLTEGLFTDVPGRAEWVEQEDPELAEKVYVKLRTAIVRTLNTSPDGTMQRRLATNGGLVLCDAKATPKGGDHGFYVTRNPQCIVEDLATPALKKVENANNRVAAINEMAMGRVSEHALKFDRAFKSGQKLVTEGPATRVRAALAAALEANDDDVVVDDVAGDDE